MSSHLYLIAPVLGGVFIGYKIFRRQAAGLPIGRASFFSQLCHRKKTTQNKEAQQAVLSPHEFRLVNFYSSPEKTLPARQSKQ